MAHTIQAVRGMNDILPDEAELWERFEEIVRAWLRSYGYRNIRTPLLEHTHLFRRAIGEATDIVEKEMYSFVDDLNGEHLTLRPEATASTVRAVIEHSLLYNGPQRLWYAGPMYRHERPQKGRYRQFHQVGAEALGFAGPDIDAELLLMCARLWDDLGLTGIALHLNSLGSLAERLAHREALVAFLQRHEADLDEDSRRRLATNPLRILDSKNPAMQAVIAGAPQLIERLGDASLAHFEGVQRVLKDAGIPYQINPRLVRGLDYYNLTVFEWVTDKLGAQGTVCGGGRYDGLIEQIGGKPAPAVGWGLGIERVLALLEDSGVQVPAQVPDAYAVIPDASALAVATVTAEALRAQGLKVVLHAGGKDGPGSMKSQFKKADASGARFALVFGGNELAEGRVAVKPLRGSGEQVLRPLADVAGWAATLAA